MGLVCEFHRNKHDSNCSKESYNRLKEYFLGHSPLKLILYEVTKCGVETDDQEVKYLAHTYSLEKPISQVGI